MTPFAVYPRPGKMERNRMIFELHCDATENGFNALVLDSYLRFWKNQIVRERIIRHTFDITDLRTIKCAQFLHQTWDPRIIGKLSSFVHRFAKVQSKCHSPGNVIVLAANKWEEVLDRILIQHSHRIELAGFISKMLMCAGPLVVARLQIGVQTKILLQQVLIVSDGIQQPVLLLLAGNLLRCLHFESHLLKLNARRPLNFAQHFVLQKLLILRQQPHTIGHHAYPRVFTVSILILHEAWPSLCPPTTIPLKINSILAHENK